MGNGGYTSVHTDVYIVYDAPTNLFLPGNARRPDAARDAVPERLQPRLRAHEHRRHADRPGPDMTVDSVTVNGQPATFTFVQPTYPGDPNGQDDPDPLAHAASKTNPVSATNPNPPACAPTGNSAPRAQGAAVPRDTSS